MGKQEKTLYSRIQLPKKTDENWKEKNPVLRDGEMVVVFDQTKSATRIKVGNGQHAYSTLPFLDGHIYKALAEVNTKIDNLQTTTAPEYSVEAETKTDTVVYHLTKNEERVGTPIIVPKQSGVLTKLNTVKSSNDAKAKDEFIITYGTDSVTIQVQEINMNKLVQTELIIIDGTSTEEVANG